MRPPDERSPTGSAPPAAGRRFLAQVVLPSMVARGTGSFVSVSAWNATPAVPAVTGYAAAMPFPGTGAVVPFWSADAPAAYPDSGANPRAEGFFPPLGGLRASLIRVDPVEAARQVGGDVDAVAPGLAESMEDAEAGVHRTDTTDLVYVIEGSIALTVGADRVMLHTGDVVVQNGTSHSWRNEGDRPATLLVFMIGAIRAAPQ